MINNREDFIEYCLKKLGKPVVDISVADDQIADRVDDAIQWWQEYHFDGIQRLYMKHKITANHIKFTADVGSSFTVGETLTGSISGATCQVYDSNEPNKIRTKKFVGTFVVGETVTGSNSGATGVIDSLFIGDIQNGYVAVSDAITSIQRILPIQGATQSGSMFDITYQIRMNDLYNVSSMSMIYYTAVQQHLSLIDFTLNTHHSVKFNRKTNKVYVNLEWEKQVNPDQHLIFECYAILDPAEYSKVYDDIFLKRYTTALIKQQWGTNLKKYQGLSLPGGVTLNGQQIYDEATTEINELEDKMQEYWSLPPDAIFIG